MFLIIFRLQLRQLSLLIHNFIKILQIVLTENTITQLFPSFDKDLVKDIAGKATLKELKVGETLMRTGQNIRSTMLIISGLIKIFREDEEGNEFFMYYLQPGQACALSMICATKQETSEIMAGLHGQQPDARVCAVRL